MNEPAWWEFWADEPEKIELVMIEKSIDPNSPVHQTLGIANVPEALVLYNEADGIVVKSVKPWEFSSLDLEALFDAVNTSSYNPSTNTYQDNATGQTTIVPQTSPGQVTLTSPSSGGFLENIGVEVLGGLAIAAALVFFGGKK